MDQQSPAANGQRRPPVTNQDGSEADPYSTDFLTDQHFDAITDEGVKSRIRIKLATQQRELDRQARALEKFNQPTTNGNGNGHAHEDAEPAKPAVDPQNILTWDDLDIQTAIREFDAAEARFFANQDDEESKKVVSSPRVRQQINAARMEMATRSARKGADERVAPLLAKNKREAEVANVLGQMFEAHADRLGGANNFSRLLSETREEVDRRLAAFGKTRDSASPSEVAMAMVGAAEARHLVSMNRDGDAGPSRRGRPEIAGEGFGGRTRSGAPDADAEVSALLKQKREPEANRAMISRFLNDRSYVGPADYTPQRVDW